MYSCCFALMENNYLFFKRKFKSHLLYERFSASPRWRGSLPSLCHDVLCTCFCYGTTILVTEEFPKSEDETKIRYLPPIEERKNRDSHCKSKTESKQLSPLMSLPSGGRKRRVLPHPRQAHADVGQNVVQAGQGQGSLLLARSCSCDSDSKDRNVSCCVKLLQGEDQRTLSSLKLSTAVTLLGNRKGFQR